MLFVLFSYVGTSRESPARRLCDLRLNRTQPSSVYTVSMVASLNAREGLRNHMAKATAITTIPTLASLHVDGNNTLLEMQTSRNRVVRM